MFSIAKDLGCHGLQHKSEEAAFPKSTNYYYRYFVDSGNTVPLLVFRWLMTPGSMRSEITQDGCLKSSKNPKSTNYR